METGLASTLDDGDHLNPLSMSSEAVSVDSPVKPVHEVSEVSNRSVMGDPNVKGKSSVMDDNRLLQCQGDRVWVHEFAEVNERSESLPIFGSLEPVHEAFLGDPTRSAVRGYEKIVSEFFVVLRPTNSLSIIVTRSW
jgi:hypothetical protein